MKKEFCPQAFYHFLSPPIWHHFRLEKKMCIYKKKTIVAFSIFSWGTNQQDIIIIFARIFITRRSKLSHRVPHTPPASAELISYLDFLLFQNNTITTPKSSWLYWYIKIPKIKHVMFLFFSTHLTNPGSGHIVASGFFKTSPDSHSCPSTISPSSQCQIRSIKPIFFIWLIKLHEGNKFVRKVDIFFYLKSYDTNVWYVKA